MKKIIIYLILTLSISGCEYENYISDVLKECNLYESKCEEDIRYICDRTVNKWGEGLDCAFYGMGCVEWYINEFETRSDCVSEK